MWVRAQVDYLQRLPNDREKRKALRSLPPSLPETYVRILETISNVYPTQTINYIRRILKWLVLEPLSPKSGILRRRGSRRTGHLFTLDFLCQAICIENKFYEPDEEDIPSPGDIERWLGCLIRLDGPFKVGSQSQRTIQLSHFTVKEFLFMNPQSISSSLAREYLVDRHGKDKGYIGRVCLTYLMHNQFRDVSLTTKLEIDNFLNSHPLYAHVTVALCDYMWYWDDQDQYSYLLIRDFLGTPLSGQFQLWDTCRSYLNATGYRGIGLKRFSQLQGPDRRVLSPLHFAAMAGLTDVMRSLLDSGADPNSTDGLAAAGLTPLHLAIASGTWYGIDLSQGYLRVDGDEDDGYDRQTRSLEVVKMLVGAGARLDQPLISQAEASRFSSNL